MQATSPLHSVVNAMERSIRAKDGAALASLLVQVESLSPAQLKAAVSLVQGGLEGLCDQLPEPFDVFVRELIKRLAIGPETPFAEYAAMFSHFVAQVYTQPWLAPVLRVLCSSAFRRARKQDDDLTARRSKPVHLSVLQSHLARLIAIILSDRPLAQQIKAGLLIAVNTAFRIYFALGEMSLCIKMVQQVESNVQESALQLAKYPRGDQVTLYYFTGKTKMYSHDFGPAERYLSDAFKLCAHYHGSAKRMILELLIPARMIRGTVPHPYLLQKHGLDGHFGRLVQCYKVGDYTHYLAAINQNRKWFMKRGLLTVMKETMKLMMYRNLFCTSFRALQSESPDIYRVPLDVFLKAVQQSGLDTDGTADLDEVECIVVSLIGQQLDRQGYMRGFIQHAARVAVLAKSSPFVKPSQVTK
ncbi:hypothetical protein BC831DRAFT_452955 [Entophlyctis helioformis]|nr:hypothetical protein BC831DRAFT_452955 [Entophlyctis helioformis]